jgi:hypothetical protein
LDEANLLANYFGIYQLAEFKALQSSLRLIYLNDVFSEISKFPLSIRQRLFGEGAKLDLVLGSVVNHPKYGHLAGVTPRGWPSGVTWSTVPGGGGTHNGITVIAADKLRSGHGSTNLILHEATHTLDRNYSISSSTEFRVVYEKTLWKSADKGYMGTYPEEALAEGVARFYHNKSANIRFKEMYPELYDWIAENYGSYQERLIQYKSRFFKPGISRKINKVLFTVYKNPHSKW